MMWDCQNHDHIVKKCNRASEIGKDRWCVQTCETENAWQTQIWLSCNTYVMKKRNENGTLISACHHSPDYSAGHPFPVRPQRSGASTFHGTVQINKVQRQGVSLLVGMVFDLTPSTFQVVILDADNFHSTLEGRPHAWMVEFYASWWEDICML